MHLTSVCSSNTRLRFLHFMLSNHSRHTYIISRTWNQRGISVLKRILCYLLDTEPFQMAFNVLFRDCRSGVSKLSRVQWTLQRKFLFLTKHTEKIPDQPSWNYEIAVGSWETNSNKLQNKITYKSTEDKVCVLWVLPADDMEADDMRYCHMQYSHRPALIFWWISWKRKSYNK